jgi:hypothetical protein
MQRVVWLALFLAACSGDVSAQAFLEEDLRCSRLTGDACAADPSCVAAPNPTVQSSCWHRDPCLAHTTRDDCIADADNHCEFREPICLACPNCPCDPLGVCTRARPNEQDLPPSACTTKPNQVACEGDTGDRCVFDVSYSICWQEP